MDEHPRTRATLAEQRSAGVGSGGTIGYTPLSAGCMAVTVEFKGGGGAGVHLALKKEEISGLTHEQAWTAFRSLIGPRSKVTAVHVDVEPTGQWLLPGSRNDVKQKHGPITAEDPGFGASTTMEVRDEYTAGVSATKSWFGKQFGVGSGRVTLHPLDPYEWVEAQDQPSGYKRAYVDKKAMPKYTLDSQ